MLNKYKEMNEIQKLIIKNLEKFGSMTRSDLVKEVNKPRTTIYDNISILMNHNFIKKFSRQINNRGRPVVFFKLMEE